jgi:hypothetical protein
MVERSAEAEPQRLYAIAAKVLAGESTARPWEMIRLQHFPWLDSEHAKAELRKWARVNRIEIKFEIRHVAAGTQMLSVAYVLFERFVPPFVY